MKKIKFINIVLNKQQRPVYTPGETVSGRIELALNDDAQLTVDGITLEFHGEARVSWSNSEYHHVRNHDGVGERRRRTVYFRSARDYCAETLQIVGGNRILLSLQQQQQQQEKGVNYVWPFQFQLPLGIPSSFEGDHGHVRYYIKLVVKKSDLFSINYRQTVHFNVIGLEDCNKPQYLIPLTAEEQKRTCCWCCKGNPINMHVRIDRQAYVPLDTIKIYANFDNRSSRNVSKTFAKLVQVVTYRAHRTHNSVALHDTHYGSNCQETRTEKRELCSVAGDGIDSNSSAEWNPLRLTIPVTSPTIRGADIIRVEFELRVSLDVAWATDLVCCLPITIGTIPYYETWQPTAATFTDMTSMPAFQQPAALPPPPPSYDNVPPTPAPTAYWELFPQPLATETTNE